MTKKNPAAVALGRRGGKVKSEAKTASARVNGLKGGRPKIVKDEELGKLLSSMNEHLKKAVKAWRRADTWEIRAQILVLKTRIDFILEYTRQK